jgi:AAHS family 3-hydroxyphenylpropionic acid transporter
MTLYPDLDWRTIFHIGGWWPLLLAAAMVPWLSESPQFAQDALARHQRKDSTGSRRIGSALFGEKRGPVTLMLWVAFFFCVLAMYLIINWLPSLLVGQGFSAREARLAALAFPLGGALGTVALGLLIRSFARRPVVIAAFVGILLSVSALAIAPQDPLFVFCAALATGFFVIGTQFFLYGLSPAYYPASVRGTGVGVAVAIGRLGSIAGPVLAGVLIGAGQSASQVLISLFPGILLAFAATLALSWMPQARG